MCLKKRTTTDECTGNAATEQNDGIMGYPFLSQEMSNDICEISIKAARIHTIESRDHTIKDMLSDDDCCGEETG